MDRYGLPIIVIIFCVSTALAASQSEQRLCYKFTWLGPRYHNNSQFANATCADVTELASGVPCQTPLVSSFDGSWPDVEYIWRYHREQATCVLANNDVCAQYTYYFDGVPENSTYMCTRAIDAMGKAITSGCFQQQNGAFVTKVCLCQSVQGGMPCNKAPWSFSHNFLVAVSFLAITIFVIN